MESSSRFVDLEDSDEGSGAESAGAILNRIAEAYDRTPRDLVHGFLQATPHLTPGEQAELLGEVIATERATGGAGSRSPSGSGGGKAAPTPITGRGGGSTPLRGKGTSQPVAGKGGAMQPAAGKGSPRPVAGKGGAVQPASGKGGAMQPAGGKGTATQTAGTRPTQQRDFAADFRTGLGRGLDFFQQGLQGLNQVGALFGFGGQGTALGDFANAAGTGANLLQQGLQGNWQQSLSQVPGMIQALQQGQIPPLPNATPEPQPVAPAPSDPNVQGQPSPSAPQTTQGADTGFSTAPRMDATALLRMILTNPSFQQALGGAIVQGQASPRAVQLSLPGAQPGTAQNLAIPLGAVMNTVGTLARESMLEFNAATQEDDPEVPEYLVSEDGEFIVDPTSPEARAALVTHYFRLAGEAERTGWIEPAGSGPEELDESEAWARDAGFFD